MQLDDDPLLSGVRFFGLCVENTGLLKDLVDVNLFNCTIELEGR